MEVYVDNVNKQDIYNFDVIIGNEILQYNRNIKGYSIFVNDRAILMQNIKDAVIDNIVIYEVINDIDFQLLTSKIYELYVRQEYLTEPLFVIIYTPDKLSFSISKIANILLFSEKINIYFLLIFDKNDFVISNKKIEFKKEQFNVFNNPFITKLMVLEGC